MRGVVGRNIAVYRLCFIIFLGYLTSIGLKAQDSAWVVGRVTVEGLKKTRLEVVRSYLCVEEGDVVSRDGLEEVLQRCRENLLHTRLFRDVVVDVDSSQGEKLRLEIRVEELWYIYPGLYFQLADRNFNEWAQLHHYSLRRINIGPTLWYFNVTGRGDVLSFLWHEGYTRRFHLAYRRDGLPRWKKWGWGMELFYRDRKEVGYRIRSNRLEFYRNDEEVQLRRRGVELYLSRQENVRTRWTFHLAYTDLRMGTHLYRLRGDFLGGVSGMRYFSLWWRYSYTALDRRDYPLSGWMAEVLVRKDGLAPSDGVQFLYTDVLWRGYRMLSERLSGGLVVRMQRQWIDTEVPYYFRHFFGYGVHQLRGYELYVVEGTDFGYLKALLTYALWRGKIRVGWGGVRLSDYRRGEGMPIELYLAFQWDVGRVWTFASVENPLNEELLTGGGPAIHLVWSNRYVMRVEWSINRRGERGVYLHFMRSY